jgi:hypothetical protein
MQIDEKNDIYRFSRKYLEKHYKKIEIKNA